jgi:hypothetical protein
MHLTIIRTNGQRQDYTIPGGVIRRLVFPKDETLEIRAQAGPKWDLGYGNGQRVEATVLSGRLGVIIDTRGRPLAYPKAGLTWRTRVEPDIQALTSTSSLMYPQNTHNRRQQT